MSKKTPLRSPFHTVPERLHDFEKKALWADIDVGIKECSRRGKEK